MNRSSMKRVMRRMESETMNAKQSLRAASARILELEDYNKKAARDITRYNEVIVRLIMGESPCQFCEDENECQLQAHVDGVGCGDWWLKYEREEEHENQNQTMVFTAIGPGAADSDSSGEIGTNDGMGPVQAGNDGEYPVEGVLPQ